MKKVFLGNTDLEVTKTAMGCLPLQRCTEEYAVELLRAAYNAGINFFDTGNAYTDSEKKIGIALGDVRKDIVLSTKSRGLDKKTVLEHIENSLEMMKTDYIDLFQFHQVSSLESILSENGPMEAALEAKKSGLIHHIGFSSHRVDVAEQAIESGLFETCQFPFSYLSDDRDIALTERCKNKGMGFIAMKGLAGGLLTNVKACYAFMSQFDNVVPIWGIQKKEELEQWIEAEKQDYKMDDDTASIIETDRKELVGSFCRNCGYCMPCTVGIDIRNCARMNMLLTRQPWQPYMTDEWYKKMQSTTECIDCRKCASKCPYGLDIPNMLKSSLKYYNEFYETHRGLV